MSEQGPASRLAKRWTHHFDDTLFLSHLPLPSLCSWPTASHPHLIRAPPYPSCLFFSMKPLLWGHLWHVDCSPVIYRLRGLIDFRVLMAFQCVPLTTPRRKITSWDSNAVSQHNSCSPKSVNVKDQPNNWKRLKELRMWHAIITNSIEPPCTARAAAWTALHNISLRNV